MKEKIKNIALKTKKYLPAAALSLTVIFLIFSGYWLLRHYRAISWNITPLNPKTINIRVVTDIHAGNQDTRDEGIESNNVLHPVNFEKNLKAALSHKESYDFILTLGDNLNSSSKKYSKKLLEITKNYPIIWTKGNHDEDKMFQLFHQPKNYYYVDKGKWRIIVLDNGNIDHSIDYAKGDYIPRGYMEPEQVEWLKETLKTDRKILITMHVPIFDRSNFDSIYPQFEYLVKMFEGSGNVKYVLSGHFHINEWHKNINGIEYYIVPSLSLEGGEGHYITLNLPND